MRCHQDAATHIFSRTSSRMTRCDHQVRRPSVPKTRCSNTHLKMQQRTSQDEDRMQQRPSVAVGQPHSLPHRSSPHITPQRHMVFAPQRGVCVCVCMCTFVCVCVCNLLDICIDRYVCVLVCLCVCVCMCVCVYVCVCLCKIHREREVVFATQRQMRAAASCLPKTICLTAPSLM